MMEPMNSPIAMDSAPVKGPSMMPSKGASAKLTQKFPSDPNAGKEGSSPATAMSAAYAATMAVDFLSLNYKSEF